MTSFTRRLVWLDPVTGMNWTPPLAVLSVSRLAWPGGVTIVEFVVQRIRNVVVISAWGAGTFEIWKTQFDAVSSRFTPIVGELTVMVPVIPMDRWGMHQNGMDLPRRRPRAPSRWFPGADRACTFAPSAH